MSTGELKGSVGDTFPTPKGGVITLEQRIKGFWLVSCSVCSADTEMYPELFKAKSYSLYKGVMPCGCNKNTRLDKRQQTLRASRLASERGYILEGFVTDNWTTKGKLKLYNPVNGNRWETACIGSLVDGDGCPVAGSKTAGNKNASPLSNIELQARAVGTLKDYHKLKEVNNKQCLLICEKCAVDEYSKGGVCNGVFLTKKSYLREGWLPCRCSSSPKYTIEQKEFKAKSIIESEGGEFISLGEDRVTLNYRCKEGHHNSQNYNCYVNDRDRCRRCITGAGVYNGYYSHREQDLDELYVVNLTLGGNSFIKVGRSFNTRGRFSSILKLGYNVKVIKKYSGIHIDVFKLEQMAHDRLKDYHIIPDIYFKGGKNECFSLEALPFAIDYLESCEDLTSL